MDQRWLIVSYFSGVDSLACSHHIDDRIPHLRRLGVEPVMLSSPCAPADADYRLVRVASPMPSGLRFEMRHVTRRAIPNSSIRRLLQIPALLAILPGYAIESLLLNFECTSSWWMTASYAAIRLVRGGGIDAIYSTGGPHSAHLAAYFAARKTGLPWVAEFQDPIVGPWIVRRKIEQRANRLLERLVIDRADALVYMTRIALDEAEKRRSTRGRGHVIYPGAELGLFDGMQRSAERNRRMVLGHFGSLGGNRNAGCVLTALNELVARHPEAADGVSLMLVGDMDRAQQAMLDAYAYPGMLDVRGKRSRADAVSAMLDCDLLLIIQNASSGSTVSIPSKAYEYLHAQVPILGLTYDNPELEEMLRHLGHMAVDLKDARGVYSLIEDAYRRWKQDGTSSCVPGSSPYTNQAAARRLVELVGEIGSKKVSAST